MSQTVTSSFINNNQQLFYHASLLKQSQKISLQIFNHKGVLKMKRFILIPKYIDQLFDAQKYIIGFDKKLRRICIIDTTKIVQGMVKGIIPNSVKQSSKWTKFYYDSRPNMIFGILDQKRIFYFHFSSFDTNLDDSIHLSSQNISVNQQNNILAMSQNKSNLIINEIYSCQEIIHKFQILSYYQMKKMKKSHLNSLQKQINNKKHLNKEIMNFQQNQIIDEDIINEQQQEKYNKNYKLALFFKNKHQLRLITINWNDDKVKNIETITNVFDFYFKNDWNLIIKLGKHNKNKNKNEQNIKQNKAIDCLAKLTNMKNYKKIFQYNSSIKLSGFQFIFSSDQDILIIDPITKIICGLHENKFIKFGDCNNIPKTLSLQNTILIMEKIDKYNLRLIFQQYKNKNNSFQYVSLIFPLNQFKDKIPQQIWLQKNLQKIFTINGFIHSNYKQRVKSCIQKYKLQQRKNNKYQKSQYSLQMQQIQIKNIIQDQQLLVLSKNFIQYFVLKDKTRVNSMIRGIFKQGIKIFFQLDIQNENYNIVDYKKYYHQRDFQKWNKHFYSIIQQYISLIQNIAFKFCKIKGKQIQQDAQNSFYGSQQLIFQENMGKIKQDIAFLIQIYNKFLNQIQKYGYSSYLINIQKVKFTIYQIRKYLNKFKSIYLIVDLFQISYQYQKSIFINTLKKLQKTFQIIFKNFKEKRKANFQMINKMGENIDNCEHLNINNQQNNSFIQCLLLHQHFEKARFLAANKKQIPQFYEIIEYLTYNLDQFQQTSYFYFMIIQQFKQSEIKQSSARQSISQSIQNNLTIQINKLNIYPFISQDLIKFFQIINQIPELQQQHSTKQNLKYIENKISQLADIALRIGNFPFIRYLCQLSIYYNLQTILFKLLNSGVIELFKQKNQRQFQLEQIKLNINNYNNEFLNSQQMNLRLILNKQVNKFVIKSMLFFQNKKNIIECFKWIIKQKDFEKNNNQFFKIFITILIGKNQIRTLLQIKRNFFIRQQDKNEIDQLLQKQLGKQNYSQFQKITNIQAHNQINYAYNQQ